MIKYVNILGRKYTVNEVEDLKTPEGELLFGFINYITRTISIRKGLSDEHARDVLAHEVAHGVMNRGGTEPLFTDQQIEAICEIASVTSIIMESAR